MMETIETQPNTSEEPTAAQIVFTQQQVMELEEKLRKAKDELNHLCQENIKLKKIFLKLNIIFLLSIHLEGTLLLF